ncbi:MAG: DUF3341 domain-containing protein [Vulcanimicrobiota bacterium]
MAERCWLLEFENHEALLQAVRQAAPEWVVDAYAPYPVPELQNLVAGPVTRTSWLIFLGGLLGASSGFALCSWSSVRAYPFQVGGTPLFSWPAYLPVTFECGVLAASLTAFLSVFIQAGLPRYHHPVFDYADFRRASSTGYFLLLRGSYEQAQSLGGRLHAE